MLPRLNKIIIIIIIVIIIIKKWRYMMRTMKDIDTLFQPLEDAISQTFIPALTGRCQCSYEERTLLSLPLRSGGLNIINPVTSASGEYHASQKISEPLKEMIVEQKESYTRPQLQSIKSNLRRKKQQEIENVALQVRESLPPPKQRTCYVKKELHPGCQFYHYKTKVSI